LKKLRQSGNRKNGDRGERVSKGEKEGEAKRRRKDRQERERERKDEGK